jgi:two-component system, NtrC family, nitrogen regulation sensor histidine kinase NtrY
MKKASFNIGLTKRIYIAMLAVVVISSLVIALFTANFFKTQNEIYHLSRLERKERRVESSIKYFTDKYDIKKDLNSVPRELYEKIEELSKENEMELKIYNTEGSILLSLDRELNPSDSIPNHIFKKIYASQDSFYILKKDKNNLSTYSILKNKKGENIGILNVPNYDFSTNGIETNKFYRTLIELYIGLLIGAAIFAFFLSRNITSSLRLIGDKMKNVSFNKKNEKIVWKNKDEIGELVNRYNTMVDELEESANLLSESERESAWREMAKQVAHEIKNPLTPMKLNVQYLEQSLKPEDEKFKEKMSRFSHKMVTQIDALTEIANEFSAFAKMPTASLAPVDLRVVLRDAVGTFDKELKIVKELNGIEKAIIKADDGQLIRVFNNLIKNSAQSIPSDRVGVVQIILIEEGNNYLIEVKDNGKGIHPSQYDKIFIPNFTTKSSGSGLGLAIVKNIIKNHGGKITFQSKVDIGTSFFLTLPKNLD